MRNRPLAESAHKARTQPANKPNHVDRRRSGAESSTGWLRAESPDIATTDSQTKRIDDKWLPDPADTQTSARGAGRWLTPRAKPGPRKQTKNHDDVRGIRGLLADLAASIRPL